MMRALLALLCMAALLSAPAWAQAPMSQTAFRDAVIAAIEARSPSSEVEIRDALGLIVRNPQSTEYPELSVNLDSGYREYVGAPHDVANIVERWARFATDGPERARRTDRIVAVIRPREVVAMYVQTMAGAATPTTVVHRPFVGDLAEVLMFDSPETLETATVESLAEAGVTPEQAWSLAESNLPVRLGALEIGGVEGADRLVYVTGGNGLALSTLADERLCGMRARVFLAIDRNAYLAADSDDAAGLRLIRAVFASIRSGGDAYSLTPLACRDGRLVEFMLD